MSPNIALSFQFLACRWCCSIISSKRILLGPSPPTTKSTKNSPQGPNRRPQIFEKMHPVRQMGQY